MNIVITLPEMMAQQVYEGCKTFIIRKSWPRNFKLTQDTVYICDDKTERVTGMFTIDKIIMTLNKKEIWEKHAAELAMSKQEYEIYCDSKITYYLWHIMLPLQFPTPYSLQDVFNMAKPPLSYNYTDVRWLLDDSWEPAIDVRRKKAVQ